MLNPQTIQDLVAARLPEAAAYEHLSRLSLHEVDTELMRLFVHAIRMTSDGAAPFQQYGSEHVLLDCCGTGGSGLTRFNTSTSVAFVVSAGGVPVAKFGNRASLRNTGSFDFLEGLGLIIPKRLEDNLSVLEECNLAFLYAPDFYPAYGKLGDIRRAIGKKTILNYLGPLLNPIAPRLRLLGTSDEIAQHLIADYLADSDDIKRAFVTSTSSGLDELDPDATSTMIDVSHKSIQETIVEGDFLPLQTQIPTSPAESAASFRALLEGKVGALDYYKRLISLNAGAAFVLADKAANLDEGKALVNELLESGAVKRQFDAVRSTYAKYS